MTDAPALSALLRDATKSLHRDAERSGVMGRVLRRVATRREYLAMLVALREIYAALEEGLRANATLPGFSALLPQGLARQSTLDADIRALAALGEPVPAAHDLAHAYAAHLRSLSAAAPLPLIAHAWLRYLGDLNGGQIVARLVREGLDLPEHCLNFYEFSFAAPAAEIAADWKTALDALPLSEEERQVLVDEACDGFRRHIALFAALGDQDASAPSSAA